MKNCLSTFYILKIEFHCTVFHLRYSYIILILVKLYYIFAPRGSGWIIGVGKVRYVIHALPRGVATPMGRWGRANSLGPLGRRDVGACFIVLFHSCCSHSRVFGKTLLYEFHISYSHTEWYLLFSDSAINYKCTMCIRSEKVEILMH